MWSAILRALFHHAIASIFSGRAWFRRKRVDFGAARRCAERYYVRNLRWEFKRYGRAELGRYVPKVDGNLRDSAWVKVTKGGGVTMGFDTPYSHFLRFNPRPRRNPRRWRIRRQRKSEGSARNCEEAARQYLRSAHYRRLVTRAANNTIQTCSRHV